jgi:hypothetical protein
VSCIKPGKPRQIAAFAKKHLVASNNSVTTLLQREGTVSQIRELENAVPGDQQWPPQRSATDVLKSNKGTGW